MQSDNRSPKKIVHFAQDKNSIKEGRNILISNSVLNALLYYIIRILGKQTGLLTMFKPVTDMILFGVACSPLANGLSFAARAPNFWLL